MGKKYTDKEINKMVKSIDIDGNGMVSDICIKLLYSLILILIFFKSDIYRGICAIIKLKIILCKKLICK